MDLRVPRDFIAGIDYWSPTILFQALRLGLSEQSSRSASPASQDAERLSFTCAPKGT
jgi:hypothetical protein